MVDRKNSMEIFIQIYFFTLNPRTKVHGSTIGIDQFEVECRYRALDRSQSTGFGNTVMGILRKFEIKFACDSAKNESKVRAQAAACWVLRWGLWWLVVAGSDFHTHMGMVS